jgi:hypothetical protein
MRPLLSVLAAARPVPMSHPLSRASHLPGRVLGVLRQSDGLSGPQPRSPAQTRRRGGMQGCPLQVFLRGSVRAFAWIPRQDPDLSRRRKDAKECSEKGFLAASRLGERSIPFPRRYPALSRGHGGAGTAKEKPFSGFLRVSAPPRENHCSSRLMRRRMDVLFSLSRISPWLRAAVRAFAWIPRQDPDLARRRKDAKECSEKGFLAASRLGERSIPFPRRTPALSRGHGGTGTAKEKPFSGFLRVSASPREHRGFAREDRNCSRGGAETRRNAGLSVLEVLRVSVAP